MNELLFVSLELSYRLVYIVEQASRTNPWPLEHLFYGLMEHFVFLDGKITL